jgi:hypothetical protein
MKQAPACLAVIVAEVPSGSTAIAMRPLSQSGVQTGTTLSFPETMARRVTV